MSTDLIKVCYEGSNGSIDIRTVYLENILHFSLSDVFVVLNKENSELGEKNPPRYIPNLIKNQLKELDPDEYKKLPHQKPSQGLEHEIFITQPGLNRVMGTDTSPAGKKFQRWLYHEVVPSLTKHGVYPPPPNQQGSALSQMAEILAQNSRALADAIVRQDKLEDDVKTVKNEVFNVQGRIEKLEETSSNYNQVYSVRDWYAQNGFYLSDERELEVVAWCENLALKNNHKTFRCNTGERFKSKFYAETIFEAKALVEASKG